MRVASPDNCLYIGDCLPVLADLKNKHGQFADLVYLDPPFNSGRNYNYAVSGKAGREKLPTKIAFHDTWKWSAATQKDLNVFVNNASKIDAETAAKFLLGIRPFLAEHYQPMLAYLTYMTPRLAMARAVMKPTASIYLHCDSTASHYLKLVMDALFGRENYCNEIVWCYTGPGKPVRHFPRKHDTLLFYAKDASQNTFNPDAVRIPYKRLNTQTGGGGIGGNLSQKSVEKYLAQGKIPEDYWLESEGLSPVGRIKSEHIGYPTQKPLSLLRRVIAASSNLGEVVLDPFCGCGTTIEACYKLERQFVGIDVSRGTKRVIKNRMEKKPGFGKLSVEDKTAKNLRDWPVLLREPERAHWADFQRSVIASIPRATQETGADGTTKKGPDGGVDGLIHLRHPHTQALSSVVIQVKRKQTKGLTVDDVSATESAATRNNAFMGLLITEGKPTKGMLNRGKRETKQFVEPGTYYPKVAILTADEVNAGEYHHAIPYKYAIEPNSKKQKSLKLSKKRRK